MKEIVTDVAIVGAGSAGLSAAYQAACAGADVLVMRREFQTRRTAV